MKFLAFCIWWIPISFNAPFQQCITISDMDVGWTAAITQSNLQKTTQSIIVTVEKLSESEIRISDYSAGLIKLGGYGDDNALDFSFDCTGIIHPFQTETIFGPLEISGGSVNESGTEIILNWKLSESKIDATSKFNSH